MKECLTDESAERLRVIYGFRKRMRTVIYTERPSLHPQRSSEDVDDDMTDEEGPTHKKQKGDAIGCPITRWSGVELVHG